MNDLSQPFLFISIIFCTLLELKKISSASAVLLSMRHSSDSANQHYYCEYNLLILILLFPNPIGSLVYDAFELFRSLGNEGLHNRPVFVLFPR